MSKISFASDNYAGIHPQILQGIMAANHGHVMAYGDDDYTKEAIAVFKQHFGEVDVFFVLNGTGANVTSLCAMTQPYEAVICAEKAHIQVDECGAPEKLTGCKLLLVKPTYGKIDVQGIQTHLHRVGDQHHVQPRVVSISQSTEYGTVYTAQEIHDISDFAHKHNMFLHMDGARIANAAAFLKTDLASFTKDVGVDVLSFGGTKNGLMIGEAVVFFNSSLAKHYRFIRKQNMQLASKMRFISAQFLALMSDDLWLKNAKQANDMATLFSHEIQKINGVKVTQPTQANAVFAIMPKSMITQMQQKFHFYVWDESLDEVRLMTSFDTKKEDVFAFVEYLRTML